MPSGIRDVKPTGQDGDSDAIGCQRRAVRRTVDAVSAAGDHRDLLLGQPGRQVGSHLLAVAGRRATAIFALMVGTLQFARAVTDVANAERILEGGVEAVLLLARRPSA